MKAGESVVFDVDTSGPQTTVRLGRYPSLEELAAIVNHRAIDVLGRELWLDVADDLEAGRGVVGAYLLRTAEQVSIPNVVTFDENMKPLPNVSCVQP